MVERSICFDPTQPELKYNSLSYIEYKPNNYANSDVSLYYQFELDAKSPEALPVIPDGCIDLIFYFHSSHSFAVIATSPEQRRTFTFKQNCQFFGIRLYPEQTSLTFHYPMKELIQQEQIPLFDVLKDQENLLEELAIRNTFMEKVQYIHSFLHRNQTANDYKKDLVSHCLNKIYASKGLLNIKQLSLETNYSERYIRKNFEDYVGFSPKKFSQIVRLQHSVYDILHQQTQLNSIVEDYGFYDMSHYYKDFKKYIGLTPEQYKELFSQTK